MIEDDALWIDALRRFWQHNYGASCGWMLKLGRSLPCKRSYWTIGVKSAPAEKWLERRQVVKHEWLVVLPFDRFEISRFFSRCRWIGSKADPFESVWRPVSLNQCSDVALSGLKVKSSWLFFYHKDFKISVKPIFNITFIIKNGHSCEKFLLIALKLETYLSPISEELEPSSDASKPKFKFLWAGGLKKCSNSDLLLNFGSFGNRTQVNFFEGEWPLKYL